MNLLIHVYALNFRTTILLLLLSSVYFAASHGLVKRNKNNILERQVSCTSSSDCKEGQDCLGFPDFTPCSSSDFNCVCLGRKCKSNSDCDEEQMCMGSLGALPCSSSDLSCFCHQTQRTCTSSSDCGETQVCYGGPIILEECSSTDLECSCRDQTFCSEDNLCKDSNFVCAGSTLSFPTIGGGFDMNETFCRSCEMYMEVLNQEPSSVSLVFGKNPCEGDDMKVSPLPTSPNGNEVSPPPPSPSGIEESPPPSTSQCPILLPSQGLRSSTTKSTTEISYRSKSSFIDSAIFKDKNQSNNIEDYIVVLRGYSFRYSFGYHSLYENYCPSIIVSPRILLTSYYCSSNKSHVEKIGLGGYPIIERIFTDTRLFGIAIIEMAEDLPGPYMQISIDRTIPLDSSFVKVVQLDKERYEKFKHGHSMQFDLPVNTNECVKKYGALMTYLDPDIDFCVGYSDRHCGQECGLETFGSPIIQYNIHSAPVLVGIKSLDLCTVSETEDPTIFSIRNYQYKDAFQQIGLKLGIDLVNDFRKVSHKRRSFVSTVSVSDSTNGSDKQIEDPNIKLNYAVDLYKKFGYSTIAILLLTTITSNVIHYGKKTGDNQAQ